MGQPILDTWGNSGEQDRQEFFPSWNWYFSEKNGKQNN